jgi:hypothetical protein
MGGQALLNTTPKAFLRFVTNGHDGSRAEKNACGNLQPKYDQSGSYCFGHNSSAERIGLAGRCIDLPPGRLSAKQLRDYFLYLKNETHFARPLLSDL